MKKWGSRGASLPEYAIILGVMVLAAVAIRGTLWEATREESAQQEACISQIPPPSLATDGSGCEVPALSTTSTVPPSTTTTTTPTTTIPPAQPSAPQNVTVRPAYDAAGNHYLDVTFTPPANAAAVPVATYEYSTDGGVKWKTRTAGTTESPLRIDFQSDTFNAPLRGASTYDVAVRAVTANGVTGKRSAMWRAGTVKSLFQCSDNTYCPEKFSTHSPTSTAITARHMLSVGATLQSGKAYFLTETSINLLVVGGGGGGGYSGGGGGGGGGVLSTTAVGSPDEPYYLVIAGQGGTVGANSRRGGSGVLSLFGSYVAYGGGGGASRDGNPANPPCGYPETQSCPTNTFSTRGTWDGPNGPWSSLVVSAIGSGGGGADTVTGYRRAGGNGRTGQGRNGGWGCANNGVNCGFDGGGGGGGGQSSNGGDGIGSGTYRGGNGGNGLGSTVEDGTTKYYGAGGGGGTVVYTYSLINQLIAAAET